MHVGTWARRCKSGCRDESGIAPKVFSKIERCTSKLVMDVNIINKEDAAQVEISFECILENRFVVVIYLHEATPLASGWDV